MPVQLHRTPLVAADPDGAVTCSLVAFHPRDRERMLFSWSARTLRGPGISRTGVAPPSMRTAWSVDNPWGTTDDPEAMRTWSYYIDEDGLKVEELLGMDPASLHGLKKRDLAKLGDAHLMKPGQAPCGTLPDAALRETYRKRSHDARKLDAVHTFQFRTRHPRRRPVGQVGCADTTMNPWHVACVQDAGDRLAFLYLENEPIHNREYPCLVGWRGRADTPVSFHEAVKFNPGEQPQVLIDGRDRTYDIEFAVSGKPLLTSEGTPIPLSQVTHFFSDLRHLFSLPKLTPTTQIGGSVVMFGEETAGDLWLGEKQLLDDVNLQRAACRGPVMLDRLYGGLSVTRPYLLNVLVGNGYVRAEESIEWKPGHFRIDPNGYDLDIYLKEALYPWNILAVGRYRKGRRKRSDQPVILSCVFGGRSGRAHFTLRRAVEEILRRADEKRIDLKGAVLLDEGGDVFQKVDYDRKGLRATPLDPLPPGGLLACQRRLVRCCFFFARG